MIAEDHDDTKDLKLLDRFLQFFDSVKSILKHMQCRIRCNIKPKTTSNRFWTPVSHMLLYVIICYHNIIINTLRWNF